MCGHKQILCVDDDWDDRSLLSETIRDMAPEMEIVEAANGVDALDFLEKAKIGNSLPCLVVLDVNMPLLDGKETLLAIQQDSRLQEVPVIIFTSSENPGDTAFFRSKGVDMVVKPYDHRSFPKIVQHFLTFCA